MKTETTKATYGNKEVTYTRPVIETREEIAEALAFLEETLSALPAQGKRGDNDPAVTTTNALLDAAAKRKATLEHVDPLKLVEKTLVALKKRIKSGEASPREKQEYAQALEQYAELLRASL